MTLEKVENLNEDEVSCMGGKQLLQEKRKSFFVGLNSGKHQAASIHYNLRDDLLEDTANAVKALHPNLSHFIEYAPAVVIQKGQGKTLQMNQFDAQTEILKEMIDAIRNDRVLMEKRLEKITADLQAAQAVAKENPPPPPPIPNEINPFGFIGHAIDRFLKN
ncbi:hypothetical protein HK100_002921 [Physocladia obscura]|uniref:Uncharacterized protein n=1 Tax=Physocladia obscura TaxID=109957 RepID=A0AAD5X9S1_9FUNG|nr:hypothetical protein HK100_002921 [Physocladia obscura]